MSSGGSLPAPPSCGAPVEGEEVRLRAREASGHVRLVLTDGEVNERAPLEGEQGLGLVGRGVLGQARLLVLLDGVLDRLLELALQLHRDDGDAVQEQHEVDAPRLGPLPFAQTAGLFEVGFGRALGDMRAVDQLGHQAQDVALVHGLGLGVQAMLGLELAELKGGGLVAQLVAQHAQGAEGAQALVGCLRVGLAELSGELVDERLLGVARVELLVLLPGLRLGRLDVVEAVRGVERQLAVVVAGSPSFQPPSIIWSMMSC